MVFKAFLILVSLVAVNCEIKTLTESNWDSILEGEWMVELLVSQRCVFYIVSPEYFNNLFVSAMLPGAQLVKVFNLHGKSSHPLPRNYQFLLDKST